MTNSAVFGFFLALLTASGAAQAETTGSAADFRFASIDGGEIALSDYAGGPVLVVNTASRCGFTSQYDGLQALYDRYRDRGLVVVGIPSDSFNQELTESAAVKEFCEVNFGIDFPMAEITPVSGPSAHPFYAWARANGAGPVWNFHKILLDGEGRIAGSYGPMVSPESPKIAKAIEALLPTPGS
jgi:glutathione peroxidase